MPIAAINERPVDRFTLGHFLVGVILQRAGVTFRRAAIAGVAWELLERPLKAAVPGLFPHPQQDSMANASLDVLAWIGGYWAAEVTDGDRGS